MVTLESYSKYLVTEKNVSENTHLSYMRDIKFFGDYLSSFGKKWDFSKVKKNTVSMYLDFLEKQGKAKSSVYRTMSSLKSFYKYLESEGLVKTSPVDGIESLKLEKKQSSKPITIKEARALLQQPVCCDYKGYRDKTMMELLCSTGIKISELIALDVSDVFLDEGYIICKGQKKTTEVYLKGSALISLRGYVKNARFNFLFENSESPALFLNINGTRLTRQGLWKIIKTYTYKANISNDISPHFLKKVSSASK